MGTDVEFLLDASPGTNSKRALDRTRGRSWSISSR